MQLRASFRHVLLLQAACLGQALTDDILGPNSVLTPLSDTVSSLLKGQGFVESSLGAVAGVLGDTQEFDYIIAGGGTAGNVVGTRLAEAGFSVAIIEAGSFYELGKPVLSTTPAGGIVGIGRNMDDSIASVDWEYQTVPQVGAKNKKFHYFSGKCLGGNSAMNFMLYHRGTTGAYDMWADLVGDDSYRLTNLQPLFQKSATFTPPDTKKRLANATTVYDANDFAAAGKGGPLEVSYTHYVSAWATWMEKGLKALGLERTVGFNKGSLLGYHYAQTTIRPESAVRSTSADFIRKASDKVTDKLSVFTDTEVTKILFDKDNNATGVKVNYGGLQYTIKASKEIILSAGAFNSPQLLMLSGIGPIETLEKFKIPVVSALEGVGQNMWDHIFFGTSFVVDFLTLGHIITDPIQLVDALLQYTTTNDGPLSSNIIEFLGWEKLPKAYRANFSAETEESLAQFPSDWPEVEFLSGNGYLGDFDWPIMQQPSDGRNYATVLGAMVAPVSRGNVTLKSASAEDAPIINPNWLTAKADQEAAVAWFKRMRDVWKAISSVTVGNEYWPGAGKDTDAEILDFIQDTFMTIWHAACTCKMGKKADPMAVVDNLARVYGVQKLRVVDASAMPILPPGHPQSSVYVLAEKIADDIIKGRS